MTKRILFVEDHEDLRGMLREPSQPFRHAVTNCLFEPLNAFSRLLTASISSSKAMRCSQ
jgi:hypothetical protein